MITILWDFAYLFIASLALGMTFGLGIAFTLKLLRSRDSPQVRAEQGSASAWGGNRVVDLHYADVWFARQRASGRLLAVRLAAVGLHGSGLALGTVHLVPM